MPSTNDILGVIMGGGRGTRLYPLTKVRAKPAVPIAGKYRLIDIPLSNCLNSDINRVAVLTQFNSVSLHRHITRTYNFDQFHRGWVQIWAAIQTIRDESWYQGTADAVRQQLFEIRASGAKYTLILAGDHIYRMDYGKMADDFWEKDADISIAVQPVSPNQASRFGILKRLEDGAISDFVEKPTEPDLLSHFVSRDDSDQPYLGSMGIYLFKTSVLEDLLESLDVDDFGGEVIPQAIHSTKVVGFSFDGYWEDVGTMRSYYEANLKLTNPDPPFNFHDVHHPVYTHARFLPGTIVSGATLEKVSLADGCFIGEAQIRNSVIGLRSQIQPGAEIENTVLMGSDYYEENATRSNPIPLGIGPNTYISGAIIDKNARIGAGVRIESFPRGTEIASEEWHVRDGIVVIPKSTVIPHGSVITPEKQELNL
jgi:glucose-1-phosphate adenylyltransferase